MLGRLPSLLTVRLLAALLLAAIGLQAGYSFDGTVRSVSGSAFSAATHEVAIAPQRRHEQAEPAIAPLPLHPPRIAAALPLWRAALPPQAAPRPDSTGPPTRTILARPSSPRAPPLA